MHRYLTKTGYHILTALLLTSCVSSVSSMPIAPDTTATWSLADAMPALRAASCEDATDKTVKAGTPLTLAYTPIETKLISDQLPENVSMHGAWHVTSDNANWGGVSGLDYTPKGALIAVSDQGVMFDLPLNGAQPEPDAHLTYLLGANGKQLSGKRRRDSEGLAIYDGAALISFERDHRIDVYDFETCGAAARPATLATLPNTRDGQPIAPNRGVEALAVSANGTISYAYELPTAQSAPIGVIGKDGQPEILPARISTPLAYSVVGRDQTVLTGGQELTADLLRSYDPLRGVRARLRVADTQITLAPPVPVDNFEGVALQPMDDGSVIAWIISDNNFSDDQRTLLFAFRIANK